MANEIERYQFNKLMGKINYVLGELTSYIDTIGAIRKFTIPGEYTFKVPIGVTSILVSAIGAGGGGGGGGGYDSGNVAAGSGGGGGGRGEYIIDQAITVTPGETLTVIVGGAGTAGNAGTNGSYGGNGGPGANGGDTILKRGTTALVTMAGGTGGGAGVAGDHYNTRAVQGGSGGTIGGVNGEATQTPPSSWTSVAFKILGHGGSAGVTSYFDTYGNGGSGGNGGGFSEATGQDNRQYPSGGWNGKGGALAICFGQGNNYDVIQW